MFVVLLATIETRDSFFMMACIQSIFLKTNTNTSCRGDLRQTHSMLAQVRTPSTTNVPNIHGASGRDRHHKLGTTLEHRHLRIQHHRRQQATAARRREQADTFVHTCHTRNKTAKTHWIARDNFNDFKRLLRHCKGQINHHCKQPHLFPHTAVILDDKIVSHAECPLRRQLSLCSGFGPDVTQFSISNTTELAVPGDPAIYKCTKMFWEHVLFAPTTLAIGVHKPDTETSDVLPEQRSLCLKSVLEAAGLTTHTRSSPSRLQPEWSNGTKRQWYTYLETQTKRGWRHAKTNISPWNCEAP